MALVNREPREELLPTLEAMVDDPVARDVKVILPDVLARYGSEGEPALLRLLQDSWWEVRNNAVLSLKEMGTVHAVRPLEVLRRSDPELFVRENAAEAIQAIQAIGIRSLDRSVTNED